MKAKLTRMEVHPTAHLESGHTEIVFPSAEMNDWSSCEAHLTKKLQNMELQKKGSHSRLEHSALDETCLLTPPNTPLNLEQMDSETDQQETISYHQHFKYTGANKQEEGKRILFTL